MESRRQHQWIWAPSAENHCEGSAEDEWDPRWKDASHQGGHRLLPERNGPPAWRSSRRMLVGTLTCGRRRRRQRETGGWLVRDILLEAKAPVVYGMDREAGLSPTRRCGKGRRAGTLRKHIKTWLKYRAWLRPTFEVEWPWEPCHFTACLEARAAEPCGKSIPASLLKTLIFMGHAAEIVKSEQINAASAVRNTLEGRCRDWSTGSNNW